MIGSKELTATLLLIYDTSILLDSNYVRNGNKYSNLHALYWIRRTLRITHAAMIPMN